MHSRMRNGVDRMGVGAVVLKSLAVFSFKSYFHKMVLLFLSLLLLSRDLITSS
jgi:hypothetical protein